eukprot:CAMPEP_0180784502 /NCGR_PEP_ID=MMETSP1038_2-20121128/49639_1 /TAXON_ID=632150 /ORGANISM="Azadinium spinosum, Strain 3D9" /LENGTH=96 /DNA_ID=CAMNT_0022821237 /DNA_START=1 /DNA_END=288 /DNA_ORIENTATION=+
MTSWLRTKPNYGIGTCKGAGPPPVSFSSGLSDCSSFKVVDTLAGAVGDDLVVTLKSSSVSKWGWPTSKLPLWCHPMMGEAGSKTAGVPALMDAPVV